MCVCVFLYATNMIGMELANFLSELSFPFVLPTLYRMAITTLATIFEFLAPAAIRFEQIQILATA